ncbi:hypothetical protein B4Q13_18235 [Lacticaseibacillus rhamnosus]
MGKWVLVSGWTALELAAIDTPGLEPEPWLDRLNELASQLGDRLRNFNDGRDFVETAQRSLFGELGFHGNEDDFFDPRNSCLDQVLERRVGIPITLSVMYMEVARRLAMPVFGIAEHLRLRTEELCATFDEARGVWRVRLRSSAPHSVVEAWMRELICAVGRLKPP